MSLLISTYHPSLTYHTLTRPPVTLHHLHPLTQPSDSEEDDEEEEEGGGMAEEEDSQGEESVSA